MLSSKFRAVSLASGSSGNALLIETATTAIVVDAGLAARRLRGDLTALEVPSGKARAVLVTHGHDDHARGAAALAAQLGASIAGTARTLAGLELGEREQTELTIDRPAAFGDITVTPFAIPHDAVCTVGFLIEHDAVRVAIATDLGHVPPAVQEYLNSADLVIIDCNHDRNRLANGSYPLSQKRRIASETGHLSNDQAAECIARCLEHRPRSFWLAHLSQENNTHALAKETLRRRVGSVDAAIEIAARDRRSVSWHGGRWTQLRLF